MVDTLFEKSFGMFDLILWPKKSLIVFSQNFVFGLPEGKLLVEEYYILIFETLKGKNDRRNFGGTLRQKETKRRQTKL